MSITEELTNWRSEQKCLKAVEALNRNAFTAIYCPVPNDAANYIIKAATDAITVGFGGSMTIADLGVKKILAGQGKEILNHSDSSLSKEQKMEVMRRQLTCDLFLCSSNALTITGELINIDATGNRAGAMFFGPKKVIVAIGRNKLVDGSVQDAIRRVKDWATPPNAKRLNFNTPCAKTGFCSDCDSPDRLCRVTTVIDRRPRLTDLHLLVINADLGL